MNPIFADTSYFIALLHKRDSLNAKASTLAVSLQRPLVTTGWVISELTAYMAKPPQRERFIAFRRSFFASAQIMVVPATPNWYEQGIELYCQRPDKAWSLVDCISFRVMEQLEIDEALTADHHFEQAGFTILMG